MAQDKWVYNLIVYTYRGYITLQYRSEIIGPCPTCNWAFVPILFDIFKSFGTPGGWNAANTRPPAGSLCCALIYRPFVNNRLDSVSLGRISCSWMRFCCQFFTDCTMVNHHFFTRDMLHRWLIYTMNPKLLFIRGGCLFWIWNLFS